MEIAMLMPVNVAAAKIRGVHTAMTNTLDTPVEALERSLPIRVRRFSLRRGSGGASGSNWLTQGAPIQSGGAP